jgi:hypothetical protein
VNPARPITELATDFTPKLRYPGLSRKIKKAMPFINWRRSGRGVLQSQRASDSVE